MDPVIVSAAGVLVAVIGAVIAARKYVKDERRQDEKTAYEILDRLRAEEDRRQDVERQCKQDEEKEEAKQAASAMVVIPTREEVQKYSKNRFFLMISCLLPWSDGTTKAEGVVRAQNYMKTMCEWMNSFWIRTTVATVAVAEAAVLFIMIYRELRSLIL